MKAAEEAREREREMERQRLQREAEERRIAEEKAKAEAEKNELRRVLQERVTLAEERMNARVMNAPEAVAASRAEFTKNKGKLKSDLKKATTFTRKV